MCVYIVLSIFYLVNQFMMCTYGDGCLFSSCGGEIDVMIWIYDNHSYHRRDDSSTLRGVLYSMIFILGVYKVK